MNEKQHHSPSISDPSLLFSHHAERLRPTARRATFERAWSQVTGDDRLSNHETDAVASGFWRPGQDDLLRPWVDRYVAELPALWDARSPQVAGTLARELFPTTLVEQDVHDRTAVLEQGDHPAGLRRYVAEQRDDLRRALAARRRA